MIKPAPAGPFCVLLAAAAMTVSCGRKEGVPSGTGPGQPRHDRAIYSGETPAGAGQPILVADLKDFEKPSDPLEFTRFFHFPPVERGKTETCWSFAATSLLESELRRQGKAEVKLSEMFIVYWEYVEKARRFVREKDDSILDQCSEPGSAMDRIGQYGLVRASDYTGLPDVKTGHDHGLLFKEFRDYLMGLAARGDWDESKALSGVRAMLDRRLGRPPDRISVDSRSLTPLQYLADLGLRPGDYLSFASSMSLPFYTKGELRVPGDGWLGREFYNLPLYEFSLALLRAMRKGFTAALAVDFSGPGYSEENDVAMVPTFDIPSSYIDQSSREYRFVSGATAGHRAVHCVGYLESGKGNWYLIKDSGETAFRSKAKGYIFCQDDYMRLKCLMFTVHKDAVKEILEKFATE